MNTFFHGIIEKINCRRGLFFTYRHCQDFSLLQTVDMQYARVVAMPYKVTEMWEYALPACNRPKSA